VKLGAFVGLKTMPAAAPFPEPYWNKKIVAIIFGYDGTQAEGEAAIKPLLAALPQPIMNGAGFMPYTTLQTLFDPLMPKGMQWYWKGDFVKELSDEAIDVHIQQHMKSPSALCLTHLYPIDGAVHNVKPGD